MFPLVPGGASGSTLASIVDGLSIDRNASTNHHNYNGKNALNVGIVQADQLFLRGQPVSGYVKQDVTAVPTANPLIWNITIRDYVGKPSIFFDSYKQPQSNFSVSGTVARLGFLNPGFESGVASWGIGCGVVTTSSNPYSGTQCVSLANANSFIRQTIASGLISGLSYIVSVKVRGDVGTSTYAVLAADDGVGGAYVFQNQSLTSSWATLSVTFVADSTGQCGVTLARGSTGTGNAYFDVVSIAIRVLNPGFESSLTSWTTGAGSPAISTTSPYSGTNCVSFPTSSSGAFISQVFTGLTPGATYTAKVQARGDAGNTAQAALQCDNNAGVGLVSTFLVPGSAWAQMTRTYTADSTGNLRVVLGRSGGVGTGAIYFDSVELYPSQVFLNADFESGLTSWGVSEYGITGVNPHGGSYSFYLTVPGYIYQSVTSTSIVSGGVYLLTAWVRGDAGVTGTVYINAHDGTGGNVQNSVPITLTSAWQQITLSYLANGSGAIGFAPTRSAGGTGPMYVDDLDISGAYQPSIFAITFVSGCQPMPGEEVVFSGDIAI